MTVDWLLRALAAGLLLGIAALAAERVAGWFRWPRRWIWMAAMAGSLLLPIATLAAPGVLPSLRLPAFSAPPPPLPSTATPAAPRAESAESAVLESLPATPRTLPRGAGVAWLAASLAMLGTLAWSRRRLRALCRGAVARRVDGARVLISEHAGPLVLGVLDPEVVLPRWVLEAPPDERHLVVRHEQEHVRAGDPWLLALGTLAVAALPWSPALWWQHRRLRLAVETDCDARVLARGADRRAYGRVLLRTAGQPQRFAPPALAWGGHASHLERRIVAMTMTRPRHRLLRALPLAALALAVAAAACHVASDPGVGATPGDRDPAGTPIVVETHGGRESASREQPDGNTLVMMRRVPDPSRGYLGYNRYYHKERPIVLRDGQPVGQRVSNFPLVAEIEPGSPAKKAGLRVGDVILSINGLDAREPPPAHGVLRPGMVRDVRVRRGRRELDVRMVATAPPPETWPPTDAVFDRRHRQKQELERVLLRLYPESGQ